MDNTSSNINISVSISYWTASTNTEGQDKKKKSSTALRQKQGQKKIFAINIFGFCLSQRTHNTAHTHNVILCTGQKIHSSSRIYSTAPQRDSMMTTKQGLLCFCYSFIFFLARRPLRIRVHHFAESFHKLFSLRWRYKSEFMEYEPKVQAHRHFPFV